ncbi:MAG: PCYCGC motif-containing (lipo)protein [Anaerolineae bacterium]
MPKQSFLILFVLLLGGLLLAGCAGSGQSAGKVKLADVAALPEQVRRAPAAVRTAYQFAAANPDALANVPCYCGCGAIGHKSNLACYVKEFSADGRPVFDSHALGCSICVDIALDVMKMTNEGRSPAEIRQQIVDTYSKFGPANQ